jgi:hypothetical protein
MTAFRAFSKANDAADPDLEATRLQERMKNLEEELAKKGAENANVFDTLKENVNFYDELRDDN